MKIMNRSAYFKIKGKVESYTRFFFSKQGNGEVHISVIRWFPEEGKASYKSGPLKRNPKFMPIGVGHIDKVIRDMFDGKNPWREVDARTFHKLILEAQDAKIAMKRKKKF